MNRTRRYYSKVSEGTNTEYFSHIWNINKYHIMIQMTEKLAYKMESARMVG